MAALADLECHVAGPCQPEHRLRRFTILLERRLARRLQLIQRSLLEVAQSVVQALDYFACQILFIHSEIPLSFSSNAKACVAREQCVFTLPAEQPMTDAASATSISSQ